VYAFVQSTNRSRVAISSIIVSALTTGFGSALISYDMDTSPKKRRETPAFYGFVPPTGRGLVFFLMMINSTSHFLAKIMAIALLGAVSETWVVLYLLGDLILFILYTIIRNDFFYFIPVQSFIGSLALSLLMRTLEKVRYGDCCAKLLSTQPNQMNTTIGPRRLHSFVAIQERFKFRRALLQYQPRPLTSFSRCLRSFVQLLLRGGRSG
jgi:hypothetical protein